MRRKYWEEDGASGVICNGERLTADVVVSASLQIAQFHT